MNNELERIWKKPVVANRDTIPTFTWTDWGKWRETLLRIAGALAKIRTQNLPNTSLPLANLLGSNLGIVYVVVSIVTIIIIIIIIVVIIIVISLFVIISYYYYYYRLLTGHWLLTSAR
jgi:hypothetical protein